MVMPPHCNSLGRQCRELSLTVWIGHLDDESATAVDAKGTWIMGHDQRVTYRDPYVEGRQLFVDGTFHVPCKHLVVEGDRARCKVLGLRGKLPRVSKKTERRALRVGGERFSIVYKRKRRTLKLATRRAARIAAANGQGSNPCVGAPCRTIDNRRGAACCRDLRISIELPHTQARTEALLRSRKVPIVSRVSREDDDTVEIDLVSTCGYLMEDGIRCALHDRTRPNGRPAKPGLCYEWPEVGPDDSGHPGCALLDDQSS